ncbi:AAA family ATPase [Paenibacillus soyae]|uniref:ATP-binding protein n=1 Tax=Paenibacillus soyae TaxID=2969249 RepID=A0A9X2MW37_9BACL|nr:ATP-binding protein [Paenibacillus soyae]MCR2807505.1 ATP-binding protein [Paenibacillus soyae]
MGKTSSNTRLPRAKGIDMAAYYAAKECARKVKRIVLPPRNRQIVEEFITILGMKEKFEQHEVPIPNKVVMFGPPGTGKTLTAFYMASRLELPLILVRLDAIIHSHLGETASNVRKIFEYAKATPCVLFLDEFDAIARTRENNDEVKEMARVVNTLLQCLDEFEGDSIFMAATNLETELDNAIWRRFDTKMAYSLPDEAGREQYISLLIGEFGQEEDVRAIASERLAGCSYADMEQIVLKAKRKAIIEDSPLRTAHIDEALAEYQPKTC